MFLEGQMGVADHLVREDGSRVHFNHSKPHAGQRGDTYLPSWGADGRFAGSEAVYSAGKWMVKTNDGWTYIFPYRPQALPQNVTVLTNFIDPAGNKAKRPSRSILVARQESGFILKMIRSIASGASLPLMAVVCNMNTTPVDG